MKKVKFKLKQIILKENLKLKIFKIQKYYIMTNLN